MAKKNTSREVKGFSVRSNKSKKENVFAYSDMWEALTLSQEGVVELSEEDEFDDEGYIAGGSLPYCLEAIMPFLTMEMEMEDDMDDISEEMDIENFFKGKTEKRSQKLEKIKQACLTKGEYKGQGWLIRSRHTHEYCEYMANNGYPVVID